MPTISNNINGVTVEFSSAVNKNIGQRIFDAFKASG